MYPAGAARRQAAIARLMLMIQIPLTLILAVFLFYELGLSTRPHHLGVAAVTTAVYLVVMAGSTTFLQRVWRGKARRLAAESEELRQRYGDGSA
jgi:membrane protein YdbS with pleckstrin-like domain